MFKQPILRKFRPVVSFFMAIFLLFCIFASSAPKVLAGKDKPIPIVIALNDNYLYPAIVSMTSMLENANEETFYKIYAMVSEEFSAESMQKLSSLQERYSNCEFEFINMKDQFSERKLSFTYLSKETYYRLAMPSIIPECFSKCIYLDVDTIIYKDLTELFNLNIEGFAIGGALDAPNFRQGLMDKQVSKCDRYVNAGILLWNLDFCRANNIEAKFSDCLARITKPHFNDQTIINEVLYDSIFHIPKKYNATYESYDAYCKAHGFTSPSEWEEMQTDPAIVHFAGGAKPWKYTTWDSQKDWWRYACTTQFWPEIKAKYFGSLGSAGKTFVSALTSAAADVPCSIETEPQRTLVAKKPKVSVIIPVYNTARYLDKCLTSVVGQTLEDIEIICVNDGSTDNSLEILQRFKAQDSRIIIIDKPNGGEASARNAGLARVTGEYIGWVDSDDWIEPDTYETVYELATKENVDVVKWNYTDDTKPAAGSGRTSKIVFPHTKTAVFLGGGNSVWSKLYKFDLIKGEQFDEALRFGTDLEFNIRILQKAQSILKLDKQLYHYSVKPSSICARLRKGSQERKEEDRKLANKVFEQLIKLGDQFTPDVLRWSEKFFGSTLEPEEAKAKIEELVTRPSHKRSEVAVVTTLDDGYLYQTVVAFTSMLETANPGTFYKIFIMIPWDFKPESREKLQFLQEKYSNCSIVFIDMGHQCEEWKMGKGTHTPTFYRLMLDLIPDPDVDMLFYTDPDVVIAQDLSCCMQIDMGEAWCAAVPDPYAKGRKSDGSFMVGIEDRSDYALAGNFVVSLKKWREVNLTQRFADFMNAHRGKVNDMAALNAVCYGHFKRLPVKYCMTPRMTEVSNKEAREAFTDEELAEARQTPLIIHYATYRPWVEPSKVLFSDRWWKYAYGSHCWPEIKAKFIDSLKEDKDRCYVVDCLPAGAVDQKAVPAPVSAAEQKVVPAPVSIAEQKIVPLQAVAAQQKVVPAPAVAAEQKAVPAPVSIAEQKIVSLQAVAAEQKVVPAPVSIAEQKIVPLQAVAAQQKVVPAPAVAVRQRKIAYPVEAKFNFELCPGLNMEDTTTRSWWQAARKSGHWSEIKAKHFSHLPIKTRININSYFLQEGGAAA